MLEVIGQYYTVIREKKTIFNSDKNFTLDQQKWIISTYSCIHKFNTVKRIIFTIIKEINKVRKTMQKFLWGGAELNKIYYQY